MQLLKYVNKLINIDMTEIAMPKIKEIEKVIFSPKVKILPANDTDFKIMRIEIGENYTRIDFVYNNGRFDWVQIQPKSFIRPVGSKTCYPLIKVQGIPVAPNKHIFKTRNETLYYTLYFAAIPNNVKEIDIIEREINTYGHNYFNFYGVSMEKIMTEKIEVGN